MLLLCVVLFVLVLFCDGCVRRMFRSVLVGFVGGLGSGCILVGCVCFRRRCT